MPQLKLSAITCEYDQQKVIQDLSFELQQNEIIALLGPSGCGKTTLLKAIAGLMPISNGKIELQQEVVNSPSFTLPSEKRRLGMIFQDYALFPHLSVAENIAFGIQDWPVDKRQQRVEELLKLIRLDAYGDRYPHELSGGQQQRVAIARGLAYQPKLMLLDEAFSNIDSHSRIDLMKEIRQILKSQEVAAILVTHSKEEAFMFADRIAIINQGKIAQMADAQQLYSHPESKFVADFIGKTNYVDIMEFDSNRLKTELGWVDSNDPDQKIDCGTQLMLRPEQIDIEKQLDENLTDSQLEITERAFWGTYWVYQIANKQSDFKVEANSSLEFEIGEQVHIRVRPHRLVLF